MRTIIRNSVLTASIALVALACGGSDNESKTANEAQQAMPPPPPPPAPMPPPQPQQQQPMGTENMEDQTMRSTTDESSMKAKQVTTLSDGEIAAIESAANTGEIQMAELAKKQGTSPVVKDFATMMITHHKDADGKLKTIVKKQNITIKEDDTSNKLKADVTTMTTELRSKKGKEFDKAYIDDQVKAHTDVLDIIENQMMPSVQNGDLKAHLADVHRTVADHLQKAQDAQSKLQPVGTTETTGATKKGKTDTTDKTKAKPKGDTTQPKCDPAVDPSCARMQQPAKPDTKEY
jgi:putative membrane protein